MAQLTFPFSMATPPVYPGTPPAEADVVVIGGGVIGIMSALFLARSGARVVVVEKGRVAAEQSSRNWGWIRVQGRDWAEVPFALEAQRLWAEIAAECDVDIGLRQTGCTYLASDEATLARRVAWQQQAVGLGVNCRAMDSAEVAAMMPDATRKWAGAIHTASDMRAEPWVAVPAVARLAVSEGVRIVEGCAVRGLDIAAGRIAGVVTEAGRIACADVVVAGGAWSRLLLQRHGVDIPQLSVRSTVVATNVLPQVFEGQAVDSRVAFRRRADGGYTLASGGQNELFVGRDAFASFGAYWPALLRNPTGTMIMPAAPSGFPDAWGTPRHWAADQQSPFERRRILSPAPSPRRVRRAVSGFAEAFQGIGPVKVRKAWAGMIDAMPDIVPVVDRAGIDGLTIATGMCGHGFGIAPAFGKAVAALVTGVDVAHDLSRFRLSRFSDGSPLEIGPDL